mmetsp:Transcript_18705/g.26875  ORF Transcript_18705/g.26875 Transcript_18705/m.26875 type:complete len:244 (+) Transcript_18705:1066-1797(+)
MLVLEQQLVLDATQLARASHLIRPHWRPIGDQAALDACVLLEIPAVDEQQWSQEELQQQQQGADDVLTPRVLGVPAHVEADRHQEHHPGLLVAVEQLQLLLAEDLDFGIEQLDEAEQQRQRYGYHLRERAQPLAAVVEQRPRQHSAGGVQRQPYHLLHQLHEVGRECLDVAAEELEPVHRERWKEQHQVVIVTLVHRHSRHLSHLLIFLIDPFVYQQHVPKEITVKLHWSHLRTLRHQVDDSW